MKLIFNLFAVFSMIFRVIGNKIKKSSVKDIVYKLQNDNNYRLGKVDEMYFTVGKIINPDYEKVYKTLKEKIIGIQTEKFEVKGVFDIDSDNFLVFVLCNDYDVTLGTNGRNNLSKFVRLFYFKVQRIAKETKVEMCTHTFEDLNEKNLLNDFYMQAEKMFK